jgi:hypothetical protein
VTAPGEHWLWRLDAAGWLDAARVELARARARLDARRTVVAHARRAAGMAANAVLVASARADAETMWGRSYVEHLQAIARGTLGPLPTDAQVLAARVLAVPAVAPAIVVLAARRGSDLVALLDDTDAFLRACSEAVDPPPL